MTPRPAPLRYENYVVLGDPLAGRVLLLPGEGGWRLPGFGEGARHFWQEIAHVNAWLREGLGAPATTLRCMAIAYHPEEELVTKVYAAALGAPGWPGPAGARWAAAEELPGLELEREAHRAPAAEWLAWYAAGPPPRLRAPWYLPGWHQAAIAWAEGELRRAGTPATAPAEQLRSWQRSAIVRLPTAAGPAYLKAVPPVCGHEPALTAALAAADPARFAAPVALDQARGWLLMRELRGPPLERLRDDDAVPRWQAALASFAEVQIATAGRLAELRALGVPERPLATLAARLGPLMADTAATLPGLPAGLSGGDWAALRALAPRVAPLAEELAAHGLPVALEHGDFWAGQVIAGAEGYGFLDWSDSTLAHPFFSLLLFLVEIEDFFPRVPGIRERLRDAYLEPWGALARGTDLTRAFELSQPLAALHHALNYHTAILPALEVRWEMELLLPFYLKMALRLMTQGELSGLG